MAENLQKVTQSPMDTTSQSLLTALVQVPKRGILKQSTSFEQRERSEEKTRWELKEVSAVRVV